MVDDKSSERIARRGVSIDVVVAADSDIAHILEYVPHDKVLQLRGGDLTGEDPEPYQGSNRRGLVVMVFDGAPVDEPHKEAKSIAARVFVDRRWHILLADEKGLLCILKEALEVRRVVHEERPVDRERCLRVLPHQDLNTLVMRRPEHVNNYTSKKFTFMITYERSGAARFGVGLSSVLQRRFAGRAHSSCSLVGASPPCCSEGPGDRVPVLIFDESDSFLIAATKGTSFGESDSLLMDEEGNVPIGLETSPTRTG